MEKEQSTNFGVWLASVPAGDINRVRTRLKDECIVNRQTINSWKRGATIPNERRQRIINQIAGRDIYPLP